MPRTMAHTSLLELLHAWHGAVHARRRARCVGVKWPLTHRGTERAALFPPRQVACSRTLVGVHAQRAVHAHSTAFARRLHPA